MNNPNDCKHTGVFDHLPPHKADANEPDAVHWAHIETGTTARCAHCDSVFIFREDGWDLATPEETVASGAYVAKSKTGENI